MCATAGILDPQARLAQCGPSQAHRLFWHPSLQSDVQMLQEQIEEMMQQSRANAEGKGSEVEMEMQTSESSPAPECGTLLACPALAVCTTFCLDLDILREASPAGVPWAAPD